MYNNALQLIRYTIWRLYKMKTYHYAIIFIIASITMSSFTLAHMSEQLPDYRKHKIYEPDKVIELYFNAVDRGELIVFNQRFDKSMLTPIRVEYVYELKSAISKIKIYSDLKQSIPVPEQTNCKIRGISAILDAEGNIIETEAHVWTE